MCILDVLLALLFVVNAKIDINGCLTSDGQVWCQSLKKCVKPDIVQISDKENQYLDDNACYSNIETWCESLTHCVILFREPKGNHLGSARNVLKTCWGGQEYCCKPWWDPSGCGCHDNC